MLPTITPPEGPTITPPEITVPSPRFGEFIGVKNKTKSKAHLFIDDQGNLLEDIEAAPEDAVPEKAAPEDETIGSVNQWKKNPFIKSLPKLQI